MEVQNGQISAVATPPAAPATAAPTPPAAPAPAARQGPRPTEFTRPGTLPPAAPEVVKFEEPTVFGDPGDENPEPAPEPNTTQTSDLPETPAVDPMQQAAAHELYRAARSLGFSPAEITAFQSPQQLQAAVAAASRIARSAQPQPGQKPPTQPQAQPEDDEFPEAYLKEQGVDDRVIATLRKAAEASALTKSLEAKFNEKFASIEAIEQQRQRASYFQTLDNSFASLGDDYKPVFGEGSGNQFAPNSPELLRRNAVIQIATQQHQQYQAAGYAPPPFPELLASAASAMFGVTQQTTQQKQATAERLRAQNGQFLPRPTSRETPKPQGDRAAFEAIATKLGQRGLSFENADSDIDATLLK